MNKVLISGRLTADPEVRYSNGGDAIAKYTLAVDRRFKKDGEQNADFIRCIVFGKGAEFTEKYLRKGIKMIIEGHIQTGSYKNRDGQTVYTTDVVVESQEFAESRAAQQQSQDQAKPKTENHNTYYGSNLRGTPSSDLGDGFYDIPDGVEDGVPFT